jgi:hypothetical protein
VQRRPRTFIGHPQPGDHRPGGQPLLIGSIDLPGLVRPLGAVAGRGAVAAGWGRCQAMPVQPAAEGPIRGDFQPRGGLGQLDPDAGRSPAGVAATEVEDRLQRRRVRGAMTAAPVIAGGQVGRGPVVSLRLAGAAHQVAGRADGQSELAGDLRRCGPEAGHPSDGQSQGEFRGTWHRKRLPGSGRDGIPRLYPTARSHGTFGPDFARNRRSGDRASPSRITEKRTAVDAA